MTERRLALAVAAALTLTVLLLSLLPAPSMAAFFPGSHPLTTALSTWCIRVRRGVKLSRVRGHRRLAGFALAGPRWASAFW